MCFEIRPTVWTIITSNNNKRKWISLDIMLTPTWQFSYKFGYCKRRVFMWVILVSGRQAVLQAVVWDSQMVAEIFQHNYSVWNIQKIVVYSCYLNQMEEWICVYWIFSMAAVFQLSLVCLGNLDHKRKYLIYLV